MKNYENRKKIAQIIFTTVITFSLCMTLFLTVKLFDYYNENFKNRDDVLFYNFKSHTLKNNEYKPIHEISNETYISYATSYGIDVSEWQGKIDWEKVANTGISFAMIRCGFREIVGSNVVEDSRFRENIKGATEAGLRVGVYFYGTAKTEEEAIQEAEFTYNLIKDYKITYPVAYDTEIFNNGRLMGVSYSLQTDLALTYTETLEAYGYSTMIYSYANAFTSKFDTGKFDGKLIWLANYTDDNKYSGNFSMWQYTDVGRVDGIKNNVDLNISYFEYVEDENKIIQNPNEPQIPDLEFTEVNEKVVTNKDTIYRNSPTEKIPNKLGTLKRGTNSIRIGYREDYSKIVIDGKLYYVKTSDVTKLKK